MSSAGHSIHIAFGFTDGPYGGGNQFLKALRQELRRIGSYAETLAEANAVIINSFNKGHEGLLKDVLKAKGDNSNLVIAHRVDGIFSLSRGRNHPADRALLHLNRLLADFTIFQSSWAKLEWEKIGLFMRESDQIVSNAPPFGLFSADARPFAPNGKVKLVSSSWSSNVNKGFDAYSWLDMNLNWTKYEMTFFGNSPVGFSNIVVRKPIRQDELAIQLRKFDIFISPARDECCSNSVLEALHSGLPVIGYDGGGTPELIQSGGLLFKNPTELPSAIEKIVEKYSSYRNQIAVSQISKIAEDYMAAISDYRKEATPVKAPRLRRSLFIACYLSTPAQIFWALRSRMSSIVRESKVLTSG